MTLTVVRLAAPLMAWPSDSRYRSRHTRPDPTVSAVKGLLAAAAGVPRDGQAPQWLLGLRAAARVDIPGSLVEDFHTINPLPRSKYHWLSKRDMDANEARDQKREQDADSALERRLTPQSRVAPVTVPTTGGEVKLLDVDNAEYRQKRDEALAKPGAVIGQTTVR